MKPCCVHVLWSKHASSDVYLEDKQTGYQMTYVLIQTCDICVSQCKLTCWKCFLIFLKLNEVKHKIFTLTSHPFQRFYKHARTHTGIQPRPLEPQLEILSNQEDWNMCVDLCTHVHMYVHVCVCIYYCFFSFLFCSCQLIKLPERLAGREGARPTSQVHL